MEIIENNIDKRWDWDYGISKNPNLNIEMIEKYHNINWYWYNVSHNPNLIIEMIDKFSNEDWDYILTNPFKKNYENELNKLEKLQKIQNFKMIEEELIQKTWHPSRFQDWCWDEEQKKDNQ